MSLKYTTDNEFTERTKKSSFAILLACTDSCVPFPFLLWVEDPVLFFVYASFYLIKFSAQQGFPLLFSDKKIISEFTKNQNTSISKNKKEQERLQHFSIIKFQKQ
jgi:hypothetical protein